MKRELMILILAFGLICSLIFSGCDKDDENIITPINEPPFAPSSQYPVDESNFVSTSGDFIWFCDDPDGDPLTYDVYFGTTSHLDSDDIVSFDQTGNTFHIPMLSRNTTYTWKVVVKDDHGNGHIGPVWSFTTAEYGPGDEQEFELGNSGEMISMVWIPSGLFWMGAPDYDIYHIYQGGPTHQVALSQGFWMGKYEFTQSQWETVAGYENFEWPGNPNHPAESISHNELVNDFLPLLSDEWRLPTEAEWEFACRAGSDTRFFWGDDPEYIYLNDYAWSGFNSDGTTHEVGIKDPSPWGLFDILGNVYEHCSDAYDNYPSDGEFVIDPQGPEPRGQNSIRGGSWMSYPESDLRSSRRSLCDPTQANSYHGFRLVRDAD
jgi:formylglycine-generating enzyme required for sulfatase activity